MDTSPGCVQARVAKVDDYLPGGNQWNQSINNPANRPNRIQNRGPREVINYNCNQPGHIARNCPQKPPSNMWGPWVGQGQCHSPPGPSCTHQNEMEDQETTNVRAVCNDRPPEE